MTIKSIFHAGLALAIVVGFFFLSSIVGMFVRAFQIASWLIAWSIHNFVLTGFLLVAGYIIYKLLKSK